MALYRVEFYAKTFKQLAKLPKITQKTLLEVIEALAENPRPPGAKKLVGAEDQYRVRFGDYRVIYQIRDEILLVLVLKVGHRRDVYRA